MHEIDPDPGDRDRPILTVGRMAEDGRLSFERVLELARLSVGRPLTPEEVAEARAFWSERFPDAPLADS